MPEIHWTAYGPTAILFRFADQADEASFQTCRAMIDHLENTPPPGLVEYVPACTTLLLEFEGFPTSTLHELGRRLANEFRRALPDSPTMTPVQEIPVVFDGVDLQEIAEQKSMSVEEICRIYTGQIYGVRMLGFSPGFPYLGGLDRRLQTPRRASPRTRVRAGSVAIGGEHTGIYTVDGPGGWNIIGHTPLQIFDLRRASGTSVDADAFLLKPGDRVRFVVT